MDIEKENLRELLLWFWGMVEDARTKLIAHQVAASLLRVAGLAEEFDQLVEQALKHPSPLLLAKNQEVRDTIEKLLGEEKSSEKLLEFLRNWKPEGPVQ
jgi:hypothetical protein